MDVADGFHRFGTRMVNWYLIERGGRITVVDAGMRGDWPQLTDALSALGHKVEAVVLTHAHAGHVGFAHQVKLNSYAAVWVHERDAEPGLRRFPPFRLYLADRLTAARPRPAQRAARHPDAAEVRTLTDGEVLDVPGQPRVRHLPGTPAATAPCTCRTPASSSAATRWSRSTRTGSVAGRGCSSRASTRTTSRPGHPSAGWPS